MNSIPKALVIASVGEIATGLSLLIVPSLVGWLLLGEELAGVSIPVARVAGFALIGLGVACWPGTPLVGMMIYSIAVAMYLVFVALARGMDGVLVWPAMVLHLTLSVFLGRNLFDK